MYGSERVIDRFAIGVDLDKNGLTAVAVSPAGDVLHHLLREYPGPRVYDWVLAVRDVALELESSCDASANCLGIAGPGVDAGSRFVELPPPLEVLIGIDWAAELGANHVPVLMNARAALLAEQSLGAAKNRSNVVLLALGDVVRAAFLLAGQHVQGATGHAGSLGTAAATDANLGQLTRACETLVEALDPEVVLLAAREAGESVRRQRATVVDAVAACTRRSAAILQTEDTALGGSAAAIGAAIAALRAHPRRRI